MHSGMVNLNMKKLLSNAGTGDANFVTTCPHNILTLIFLAPTFAIAPHNVASAALAQTKYNKHRLRSDKLASFYIRKGVRQIAEYRDLAEFFTRFLNFFRAVALVTPPSPCFSLVS